MKPLPEIRIKPKVKQENISIGGIHLGDSVHWNPFNLPNGHIVVVGGSGSGKTQTLKAIAWELRQWLPDLSLFIIDYHGDQSIHGETCYPITMQSDYGINPMLINIDRDGGGPDLQAIQIASSFQKAMSLGANQYGLLIEILTKCYTDRGITQDNYDSWLYQPPTFDDLDKLLFREAQENPDYKKLYLKLSPTFKYGIFSRSAFSLSGNHIRIDLSKLPPILQRLASETIVTQLNNYHRLSGETQTPRTYIFIDEAKELKGAPILDRVIADGRKYGLNLVLASQSEAHLSLDIVRNSSTKIVLPVDQTEVKRVATKFRFPEEKLARLTQFIALCRFGTVSKQIRITPYFERINMEKKIDDFIFEEVAIDSIVTSPDFKELSEFFNED